MAFDVFATQLPVGAVTAIIGGPLFLVLLTRRPRLGTTAAL
jgi:ABC-type Fe3+-siderophore transport system permease subunit